MIDHGGVIARGDARSLKREVGGDQLHVVVADIADLDGRRRDRRARRRAGAGDAIPPARSVTAPTDGGVGRDRRDRRGARRATSIAVEDLGLRQPTLDDVFLTLTGAPPETVADDLTPQTLAEDLR